MNLVNELQESAEKDDVLTVLRKTMRLASKLGRTDISAWLKSEQNGYSPDQEVPDYRKITASLHCKTNGYVPMGYGRLMDGLSPVPQFATIPDINFSDSISDAMVLITQIQQGNMIYQNIDKGAEKEKLVKSFVRLNPEYAHQLTFILQLNSVQICAIPDKIRDKVLEWACDLEVAGVNGEGMSFSAAEKAIAHSTTFNIFNSTIDQLNNGGTNQKG